MKAKNDRVVMARIRVRRKAIAPLLRGNFDYACSSAQERVGGGYFVTSAIRVGRVVYWVSSPLWERGSFLIQAPGIPNVPAEPPKCGGEGKETGE